MGSGIEQECQAGAGINQEFGLYGGIILEGHGNAHVGFTAVEFYG